MTERVTIGPFGVHFSNVNTEMGLPGHSHFAEVRLTFATAGRRGFPAFAETYAVVQDSLRDLTARPFRNATNEEVARQLFTACAALGTGPDQPPAIARWGGTYRLTRLDLDVRGVLDPIGHADGFTRYTVEA